MEHALEAPRPEVVEAREERHEDEVELDSVTLARLLAEVRNEDAFEPGAYNRMHNRHNR
ncbi:YhhA family cyclophane-containing RiPP [Methylobacterium durans]|uniref:YhhA family cyclophane-containing RiPP n=1 Tax=Methylobacterium durans TaxID=2202825 RepID=UPI0013A5A180|nr:YhhA family cyclophane-containing RiPP [Methylobacterium durans]